jgi:hypothetical protein
VRPTKVSHSPTLPFEPKQFDDLLAACDEFPAKGMYWEGNRSRLKAILLLLRHSGLRIRHTVGPRTNWGPWPTAGADGGAAGLLPRRAYTGAMRSKTAADVRQRQFERYAAMTPDERVALALRLGEEGLATYMTTHGLDRRAAIARIRATHRLGRRPSASDLDDGDC